MASRRDPVASGNRKRALPPVQSRSQSQARTQVPSSAEPPPNRARWRLAIWESQQVVPVGRPYSWNNRERTPGIAVFQWSLSGELVLRGPGAVSTPVHPGQAVLFRHGDDSVYGTEPAGSAYACDYVGIAGAGIDEHWAELMALHGPVLTLPPEWLGRLRHLMELAEPRRGLPASAQAQAIHTFITDLYDAPSGGQAGSAPVARAIAALLANPTHPVSLKELAGRHGCSREHLARAFQEQVGEAPWTWVTARRMEQARFLLTETDLPIAAVARQCGYASTQVLGRNCVAQFGVSPQALRAGRAEPGNRR